MTSFSENESRQLREYFERAHTGNESNFTIVILGPPGAGKYRIHERMIWGIYFEQYDPTLEIHDDSKIEMYGKRVVISWHNVSFPWLGIDCDSTTKQDRLTSLEGAFAHADAFMFCYDGVRRQSFEELKDTYNMWKQWNKDETIPQLFVVAAREDRSPDWVVSEEEGKKFAEDISAIFVRMSALTGKGMAQEDVFDIVGRVALRRIRAQTLRDREIVALQQCLRQRRGKCELSFAIMGGDDVGKKSVLRKIVSGDYVQPARRDLRTPQRTDVDLLGTKVQVKLKTCLLGSTTTRDEGTKDVLTRLKAADGILLLYDGTRPDSWNCLSDLFAKAVFDEKRLHRKTLFIVASKSDRWLDWKVPVAEAERFARQNNAEVICMSALTGAGLDQEAVTHLVGRTALKKWSKKPTNSEDCCEKPNASPKRISLSGLVGKMKC